MASADSHVLVVDDDPRMLSMMRRTLEADGYGVTVVQDGAEALDVLRRETVDLVILDVMLPGEDGFAVARRLGARGGPPVLFLTADDDVADRVAGLELGAVDYVTKPFDLRELRARVRAALRRGDAPHVAAPVRHAETAPSPPVARDGGTAPRPSGAEAPEATAPAVPSPPERKHVTVLVAALHVVRLLHAGVGVRP